MKNKYHHGNLKSALLNAALELLDEGGIEAVSIRAIAKKIGVAHSAPANHFKTQKILMTALVKLIFSDLHSFVNKKIDGISGNYNLEVKAFGRAVIEYAMNNPNRYRLIWRSDKIEITNKEMLNEGAVIYYQLCNLIEKHDIEFTESIDTVVIAAWSMVHGYICLRLDGILIAGTDEKNKLPREEAILDYLTRGCVVMSH